MATTTTTMPQPLPLPSARGHKFLTCVSPVIPVPPRGHEFLTCGIRAPSRPAFTLVELLVVIGIIGMLTAIAVPTIFGAVAAARNAKTKAEIDMLHMALMNYKNEYGGFPPANMAGLWRTDVSPNQVKTSHPAYKHLVRIFPRLRENLWDNQNFAGDSPFKYMAQMSPAQALVFWLYGFYENPEQPITNGGTAGTRKKIFDFDESRFYAASNYLFDGTPQEFAARGTAAAATMSPYPVYFTGHPTCGLPYVYFDSRCYGDSPASDIKYAAKSVNGDSSIAFSYINSLPPANATWGQQHMAGETFQLLAAGKDGVYASAQAAFPTTAPYPTNGQTYISVKDLVNGKGHADNITNFADRPLSNAIDALSSQ